MKTHQWWVQKVEKKKKTPKLLARDLVEKKRRGGTGWGKNRGSPKVNDLKKTAKSAGQREGTTKILPTIRRREELQKKNGVHGQPMGRNRC